jgi:ATP-dependent Clp protease protease subunit
MAVLMFDRSGQVIKPRLTMKKTKNKGEIFLYGDIGGGGWFSEGITANQFQKDLRALGNVDEIDFHLNSPGGVIFEGQAMRALLQQHKAHVVTHIDGLAASAAVAVAMGGDEIRIADGGFMMIHNARGFMFGEAKDMRKQADMLDNVNTQVAELYVQKTGATLPQVLQWMDEETWMNAEDAVAKGFADKVMEQAAVFNMLGAETKFQKTPVQLKERPNRIRAAAILAGHKTTIPPKKIRA